MNSTVKKVLQKGEIIPFSFLLVSIVLLLSPAVRAQTNNDNNNNNNGYPYANFSPSMAIIIVVLVAALFFMGFFSIYIRHCNDRSGSGVRNALSMHARRGNAASRGLEASVIETFPTFSYAEVKEHKIGKGTLECAVCLNEFEDDETIRLIPKCDHVFHPECIDAWLESHVTCPVCRANLTPQPEDGSFRLPDTDQQAQENNNTEASGNEDVAIQIPDDQTREGTEENKPRVNRNLSFNFLNRPPRTESVRRGRTLGFGKFRSHSTGHSLGQTGLVQPGENVDRFTLRLPEGIRQEMMSRALLNRTKSTAMGLPRDEGSRRGNRSGGLNDGSNRGGRSFSRIDRSDRAAKSDRWLFSKAPPFFSRALSIKSPRVMADNSEGSTSKSVKSTVKMPSFKCLEPKSADETVLVHSDSARPPV